MVSQKYQKFEEHFTEIYIVKLYGDKFTKEIMQFCQ